VEPRTSFHLLAGKSLIIFAKLWDNLAYYLVDVAFILSDCGSLKELLDFSFREELDRLNYNG